MDQREQQNAQLRERPASESEVARLGEAQEAVLGALEADLGLGPWQDTDTAGSSGCAEFEESQGKVASLASQLLEGGVPDDVWPRAADVVVDRPGEHEIVLRGEREALLRFGTLASATLRLVTG